MDKELKLDKVYVSQTVDVQPIVEFDQKNINRPSWVKLDVDKKIIFIKILFGGEAFWYRRYFENFFFPLENSSEDYKNYYNAIAKNYESFVPQNKEMIGLLLSFLKELEVKKTTKMLDLGAGTGLVTEGIVAEGFENVTLLDISEEELKIAKSKKILRNSNCIVLDITKENLQGKFDVIFETMSIDYFKGDKMASVLSKISDSLNAHGKFIVIDRHLYPEFKNFFKEIKSGKVPLQTPQGTFDYYFFIGQKLSSS
jgi:SAM-dependent methyltransferase